MEIEVGAIPLLIVGLERAHGVAVYDITDPFNPNFLQWLNTAEAPEGLLFVPAAESSNHKSLLVVSCEGDGVVMVFTTSGEGVVN